MPSKWGDSCYHTRFLTISQKYPGPRGHAHFKLDEQEVNIVYLHIMNMFVCFGLSKTCSIQPLLCQQLILPNKKPMHLLIQKPHFCFCFLSKVLKVDQMFTGKNSVQKLTCGETEMIRVVCTSCYMNCYIRGALSLQATFHTHHPSLSVTSLAIFNIRRLTQNKVLVVVTRFLFLY